LARRHVPTAVAVTGVDESGGEARAYLVDDDVVVKTQRPYRLRPRTSLAKEAYLLDALAPVLGARIPRLRGYGDVPTSDGVVEYVCMTRMAGLPVRSVTLAGAARATVLTGVGRLLRVLHATPADDPIVPRDDDAAALRRRLRFGFGDIADALAERPGAWTLPVPADEVIRRALVALPAALGRPPVVLHSNPSPTHVFVDPDTQEFTGLIDFGDSYASHPALDLHRWAAPADRVAIRDAYLDGSVATAEFDRVWTIAMIYTDLAVIASGSPDADAAAGDLTARLGDL
jgi:aminoglycoside phosphotransferase (APT) family kinase protein